MVCDYPEAYEGQPGFEYIQQVPVTWDKTIVLGSMPDQFINIARRKEKVWWLGGVTGNSAKEIKMNPLSLLNEQGIWRATIYQDDLKLPFNPNGLLIRTIQINPSSILDIPVAAGGGFVIKLEKQ